MEAAWPGCDTIVSTFRSQILEWTHRAFVLPVSCLILVGPHVLDEL